MRNFKHVVSFIAMMHRISEGTAEMKLNALSMIEIPRASFSDTCFGFYLRPA